MSDLILDGDDSGGQLAPQPKLPLQVLVDRLDIELAEDTGKVCALVKNTDLGSPKGVLFQANDFLLPEGLGPFSAWGRRRDGGEVRCRFANDSQVQVSDAH